MRKFAPATINLSRWSRFIAKTFSYPNRLTIRQQRFAVTVRTMAFGCVAPRVKIVWITLVGVKLSHIAASARNASARRNLFVSAVRFNNCNTRSSHSVSKCLVCVWKNSADAWQADRETCDRRFFTCFDNATQYACRCDSTVSGWCRIRRTKLVRPFMFTSHVWLSNWLRHVFDASLGLSNLRRLSGNVSLVLPFDVAVSGALGVTAAIRGRRVGIAVRTFGTDIFDLPDSHSAIDFTDVSRMVG